MTGYYPHDNMRYGGFLSKKEDTSFTDINKAMADHQVNQD